MCQKALLAWAFGPLLACAIRLRAPSGEPGAGEAANHAEWKHQSPLDLESWPLYQGVGPQAKSAPELKPNGWWPVGKEAFVQRPFDDAVAAACGFKLMPPTPAEGWLVFNVSSPALVPFLVPKDAPGRTDIAMVVVPGGGALQLQWENTGSDVARWLNTQGISAFVVKYRVPIMAWGMEAAIADTQRAVSLVRYKAAALGLSASRVGVFGASHGAGLMLEAASAIERLYSAADVADELSYRPDFLLGIYPQAPSQLIAPQGLDARFKAANVPPAFLVAVEDDSCIPVDSVLQLYAKLHQEGSDAVELHLFPRGQHGFGMCVRQDRAFVEALSVCSWRGLAERFIERTVLQRALPAAGDSLSAEGAAPPAH